MKKKEKKIDDSAVTLETDINTGKPKKEKLKKRRSDKRLVSDESACIENREAEANIKAKKVSVFLYLIDRLSNYIRNSLTDGFFGKIFSSYSEEKKAFKTGFFSQMYKPKKNNNLSLKKIRGFFSDKIEKSLFLNALSKFFHWLLSMPLRGYGVFLTSFGLYSIFVYYLRLLAPGMDNPNSEHVLPMFFVVIFSIPLLFVKRSLSMSIYTGKITNFLFVKLFGFRAELFENKFDTRSYRTSMMIFPGLIFGISTLFVGPTDIFLGVAAIIAVCLIMCVPEIGILLAIFMLPFFSLFESPSMILAIVVLVTSMSYLFKLICGKRIFKFELLDVAILSFLGLIYFSGVITIGGIMSYRSALISVFLVFGYFLVVNLMRTEEWIKRCILALVSSGTVVAIIGILQYILGLSPFDWMDEKLFSDISGRTTSLFENPNVLAVYLVAILMFVFCSFMLCKEKNVKLLVGFSIFAIIACLILTWSRGAWLAAIVGALIFAFINSRKTLRYVFLAAGVLPVAIYLIPNNIVNRFLSIVNLTDSSISYRVYTWKGSLKLIKDYFWSGVGYGTEAFSEAYSNYAYMGMETAEHSHNLFLQIMISMGVCGVVVFSIILLFFFQKNIEYLKAPSNDSSFVLTSAGAASIICFLVMGMFDYVWYNYRMFFLFWIVLALSIATIRVGKSEIRKKQTIDRMSDCNYSIEINVDERNRV